MPKKTREEKILARLHRLERENSQQLPPETNATQVEITKPSGISLKQISPAKAQAPLHHNIETVDYSYVAGDLKKTLILTAIALLFEIVLSLTASNWYAKLFPRLF